LFGVPIFQVELVVALKELVVCVERNTGIGIQKTGIEWTHQSAVRHFPFSFFKDIGQTLRLLSGCTTDGVFQAFFLVLDQVGPQKIKTLVEGRLWFLVPLNTRFFAFPFQALKVLPLCLCRISV